MTVREGTTNASPGPEHHVLCMKELREYLGIGPEALHVPPPVGSPQKSQTPPVGSPQESQTPPGGNAQSSRPLKVILLGHDMHGDFASMKKQGMELKERLPYSGCVDTHVMVEDTDDKSLPRGLNAWMGIYGFAALILSKPEKNKAKRVFPGAHNAGNDAVATLMVAVAQAFNMGTFPDGARDDLAAGWFNKNLPGIDKDIVLLAYDSESVEMIDTSPTSLTAPPSMALHGSDCLNWRAYHLASTEKSGTQNKQWSNYENKKFLCGNSKGFWPKYGSSRLYNSHNGPGPFHALFDEVAGRKALTVAAPSLAGLSLGASDPTAFPALTPKAPAVQQPTKPRGQIVIGGSQTAFSARAMNGTPRTSVPSVGTNPWTRGPRSTEVNAKFGRDPTTKESAPAVKGVSSATARVAVPIRCTASPSSSEESRSVGSTPPSSDAGSEEVSTLVPPRTSWAQIARGRK